MFTETDYTYNPIGQLASKTTTNSEGETKETRLNYIHDVFTDFTGSGENGSSPIIPVTGTSEYVSLLWLENNHIIDAPLEIYNLHDGKCVSGEYFEYDFFNGIGGEIARPYKKHELKIEEPISGFQQLRMNTSAGGGILEKSGDYQPTMVIDFYDISGNPAQMRKIDGNPNALIWDNNGNLLAQCSNANRSEIYFTSFEDNYREWYANEQEHVSVVEDEHCGEKSVRVANAFLVYSKSVESLVGRKYRASCFAKGNGETGCFKVQVHLSNGTILYHQPTVLLSGYWNQIYIDFEVPSTAKKVSIYLTNSNDEPIYFDDVRFHPSDARMTTYTYKPLVGMTSKTLPDGTTEYYEYDGFNRLKHIKDKDGRIVKSHDYHYKN
jgi:YD repeat-containing protein